MSEHAAGLGRFNKTVKGTLAVNNVFDTKVYSYFLMPGRSLTAELVLSF